MLTCEGTWTAIGARLGFVPPFFAPARDNPNQLANLWQQTELAYLDNPLPALFKEKLAALLGRYCEVPYCLVCHSCSLRPLGLGGRDVLALLQTPLTSDDEFDAAVLRLAAMDVIDVASCDAGTEADLFTMGSGLYFGDGLAERARQVLRHRLSTVDFQALVAFASYNKMCHEWMAAHPDVSFELDRRYLDNNVVLDDEAPALRSYFSRRAIVPAQSQARLDVAERRADEVARAEAMLDQRFAAVLALLERELETTTTSSADRERLERSLQFSQELLAVVSHDLRSPLSAILMSAAVLSRRLPETPTTTPALQRIVSSAERAERLIRDLLDFSQARLGGGIAVYPATTDLHTLVRDVVAEQQSSAPGHRFDVVVEGAADADVDVDRITQVLTNLLANAVSHGRADSAVVIDVHGAGDDVVIAVGNANRNGAIPAALLPTLFEPFKQGVREAASKSRSIGLGLSIVDHLVRAHRGTVVVTSNDEETRFTVRLPRHFAR